MYISTEDWVNYINKLSAIDKKAADLVREWAQKNGFGDRKALIDYVNAVVETYSEASGALAAAMYDATCEMEGTFYEPAEVAPTPEYGEVAKAVNGVLKQSQNPDSVANAAGRMVKRTGADTMLKNAERDGAEFAWVPHGDTCAFCIVLASRGWQHISKNSLKNGHAEHIHANCDCTYAIRHSKETNIEGYDPDKYLEMYENASDGSPKDKINALRRIIHEQDKDHINKQKRLIYKDEKRRTHRGRGYDVLKEYIEEATPGRGHIDFDPGFNIKEKPNETETAQLLFNELGGDIVLKKEKDRQKNPDYEWDGRLWDLKTTSTEKSANSAVKSGMKQIRSNPGGIILNFGDNDFSMDELIKVLDLRMTWYPNECADIMIVSKGKIQKVLRY